MADQYGQGHGPGEGSQPPRSRPRRYAYGVPNEPEYDGRDDNTGHGNGDPRGPGGQAPHNGGPQTRGGPGPYTPEGYEYSEPFDYSGPYANGAHPAPNPRPYPNGAHPAPAPRPYPNGVQPGPDPGTYPHAGRPAGAYPGQPQDETRETMALRGPFGEGSGRPNAGEEDGFLAQDTDDEGGPLPRRAGQGRADRRRAAKRIKRRRRLSATREIPILIGVALLIALVLKTFLVQAFVIPSGSMEQTIKIGDRVLVDKLTPWFGSKPERGDVVVFRDPGGWLEHEKAGNTNDPIGIKQGKEFLTFIGLLPSDDEQDLIKRVVGVGGDTVRCCDKQGRVTVNGTPLNEPYLHPDNKPSLIDFKVTVPVGRVFVMGDHRSNSADSRYHLKEPDKGMIPEDLVLGKAVVIAWPFDHWRRLEEPGTYASVPDARGAPASASAAGDNRVAQLPFSAELPLVMGVVGLYRLSDRRQRSVRSGCGGLGGRRTVRFRRSGRREAPRAGQDGRRTAADRGERQ